MKIIKLNDIALGNLSKKLINPEEAIKKFVKIESEHIQYVKIEKDVKELIKCNMHPLVEAVHQAYSLHLPLMLTPDIIWHCISSGFATHINLNAEELRNKFVDHEGKKRISIRRDDFVLNSGANPWHEVISEFASQIDLLTKNGIAEKFAANFSTTTAASKIVSQIVLMNAMQKYFEFYFSTMCGIPEIKLLGDKQDWENVMLKANQIAELIPDLNIWMTSLNEVLQQFIDASDDKIDTAFWNDIYKVSGGLGGPFVSGWIISLFPYLSDNGRNPYLTEENTWRDGLNQMFGGITTKDFDYHMNQVPFIWNYHDNEMKLLFVGGLVGVSYEPDKSLLPIFGYAITKDKDIKSN